MAEPTKRGPMEKFSIRLPKELLQELDTECFLEERSRGFHIKKALEPYLKRRKRERAKSP